MGKVYTLTLPNGYKIILETWRGKTGDRVGYITVERRGKVVLEGALIRERYGRGKKAKVVYRVYVYKGKRMIPIGKVRRKKDALREIQEYLFS